MSLETRSSSALFKRAEQLKKWEESETNREPVVVNGRSRKIKFSAGCVFLAACKAGDKDEILRLLKKGADIDTSDVDGLSALHQACIDDNLELVEFLVEHGADVNKGDNEGWTPLHATASCGFLSIAKYLIEKGANVAAVNNDGELPVDVAESDEMEDMLQQEIENRGIDPEVARNEEERLMLSDAKNWLSQGYIGDKPHPKTGATALHVAAAKGYLKVMDVLVKAGADVDAQDLDGWTPLHAAAHWGQKEACEVLVEYGCDMGIRNCVGQTSFDVAETDMVRVLEDLRKKQSTMSKDNINNRRQITANKKISSIQENCVIPLGVDRLEKKDKEDKDEKVVEKNNPPSSEERLQKVELKIQSPTAPASATPRTLHETTPPPPTEASQTSVDSDDEVDSLSTETSDTESSDVSLSQLSETETNKSEKKNRVNRDESSRLPTMAEANKTVPNTPAPSSLPAKQVETEEAPSWRRPGSFRSRLQESLRPNLSLRITEKENPTTPAAVVSRDHQQETPQEVVLRRTQSFEADEKFYRRYLELRAKINAGNSCSVVHSATPVRSASLKERHPRRTQTRGEEPLKVSKGSPLSPVSSSTTVSPATTTTTATVAPTSPVSTSPQSGAAQIRSSTPSTPTTPGGSKLSPANIFKNFFKSFVPPVRDEESETQRKAHAKRVRETRRSTQGVTLEEIKSAEQLVKKKQQQQLQQATQILPSTPPSQPDERRTACEDEVVINVHNVVAVVPPPPVSSPGLTCSVPTTTTTTSSSSSAEPVSATITTGAGGGTPTPTEERRPSWRLRVDNGSKFMLEDARKGETPGGIPTETVVRRTAVATPVTETGDTTITLPLRKNHRIEDKNTDAEKENESRNVQATQAAIQRRRRPKRRSTGVVHVDMDEIDPDRHGGGQEDSLANSVESGAENSEPSSRLNSEENSPVVPDRNATENGEILDYKKLYEESKVENNRLRCKLKGTEDELAEARAAAEKSALLATRNSLSEVEKRERRAMERKLSEMEEELKQLQKLKSDNERLRAENRALTRVVSKLTSSHLK